MLIRQIRVANLLSFGPDMPPLALRGLNVLIGANGSGKSNLIEVMGLLHAAPRDLTVPIREGGGIGEWLWRGARTDGIGAIDVEVLNPIVGFLRYKLGITQVGQRLELVDELLEQTQKAPSETDVQFYYRYQDGRPMLYNLVKFVFPGHPEKNRDEYSTFRREELKPDQSILSQLKSPDQYPELTQLGVQLEKIRLYREWSFGRKTALRLPQPTDAPEDFLVEDASNLGIVLNNLEYRSGDTWQTILEHLRRFCEGFEDVSTRIQGGTVQLFLRERGVGQIPASRLSDGTLRYLCLLAILCHPEPPPLVCIEEPELGLHPDAIPAIADMLKIASQRTQLIVTTHSDGLIDALSDEPEDVIVCEKEDGRTVMRRLDGSALSVWLEKYSLGQLWRRGDIGGNRW